jgi:hypothetical protein
VENEESNADDAKHAGCLSGSVKAKLSNGRAASTSPAAFQRRDHLQKVKRPETGRRSA